MKKRGFTMIISAPPNAVLLTDGETQVFGENFLRFEDKTFFSVLFPDNAIPLTAVTKNGQIQKGDGVYFLNYLGEDMLCFTKRKFYGAFTLIAQKSTQGVTVSVYGDGGLKVAVDGNYGAEIFSYPFFATTANIYIENFGYSAIIAVHFSCINKCAVYLTSSESIKEIYQGACNEIHLNGDLKIINNLSDTASHTVNIDFIRNQNFKAYKSVKTPTNLDFYNLPEEVIPIAFLEELLVGGNYADFLCEDLKERSFFIPDYLGNFTKVITLPNTIKEIGLLYPEENSAYDFTVKRCKITVQNYKITNLKLED
jgi:hypothetical protein